jgi:hypothetical protein
MALLLREALVTAAVRKQPQATDVNLMTCAADLY